MIYFNYRKGDFMSKNIEMIKSFFKVIRGIDEDVVIPDMYAASVFEIDYDYLHKRGIYNLIFDIDNTILPVNGMDVSKELQNLFADLDKRGFNILIVSNNTKERVIPVAYKLETGYLFKADKPKKEAFEKALITLDSNRENTAMIGDQMLTDIKGANEFGIYSVLVDPVGDKYDFKTGTSRVLQNIMTKKLNKRKKFTVNSYYNNKEER